MAERAKSDEIDRVKCINYATRALANCKTPFFMSQASYAFKTAELARSLFLSRTDSDYVCKITSDEIEQRAQVIWAAALLSQVCQAYDINFDNVCDIANPEVAGYLQWVLPNKAVSLVEGTAAILSQLGQRNTYATCGPIFVVLARSIVAAENIGESDAINSVPNDSPTAFSTVLWNISNTLKQLKKAQVWQWSPFVKHCLKESIKIAEKWEDNLIYPDVRFRCGDIRHCVDWRLDMSIPDKPREYKAYIEL